MKKLSKILSVVLSLAMCLSLAVPAFAVSFDDLQEAITGAFSDTAELVDEAAPADEYVSTEPEEPAEPEESDTTHVNGALVREDEDGTKYYGCAWNKQDDDKWYYGIDAWDKDGTRNVMLHEDVTCEDGDTRNQVYISKSNSITKLDLNLGNVIKLVCKEAHKSDGGVQKERKELSEGKTGNKTRRRGLRLKKGV